MPYLTVLKYPDDRLRLVAKPVTTFDDDLRSLVKDMFSLMYNDHGVGLAASQINIQQRIFVMDCSRSLDNPVCIINPQITEKEGDVTSEEGCLSFPGVYAKLKRAKTIKVSYTDENGVPHERFAQGIESICIQHETEHLDGVLFIDHLSRLKRHRLLKKLEKYQRETF